MARKTSLLLAKFFEAGQAPPKTIGIGDKNKTDIFMARKMSLLLAQFFEAGYV